MKDLKQEIILHKLRTWAVQQRKSASWRRENALNHVRDYLKQGRSVDSIKRGDQGTVLNDESDPGDQTGYHLPPQDSFLEGLMAAEELENLLSRLPEGLQEILTEFVEGRSTADIAARHGVDVRTVNRYHHRIADAAVALGILPHHPRHGSASGPTQN